MDEILTLQRLPSAHWLHSHCSAGPALGVRCLQARRKEPGLWSPETQAHGKAYLSEPTAHLQGGVRKSPVYTQCSPSGRGAWPGVAHRPKAWGCWPPASSLT